MRRGALLLLAALAPAIAGAQVLRGRVTSVDGAPLEAAFVRLLADSSRRVPALGEANTNALGRFAFASVPPGARFAWIGRLGYDGVVLALPAADSLVVALEKFGVAQARRDSIAYARHRERVAIARSRPRHWVCTLGKKTARRRAEEAYVAFVLADTSGMGRVGIEHRVPRDFAAFERMFVRPLSGKECRRFAEGYDRQGSGLETDTIEVYRFGTELYLPELGDGGAFADADGKIITIFIVPS